MIDNLITHLQLFAIGLSFGIAGPCLLTCTPVIVAYLAGRRSAWREMLVEIFVFLSGRLAAYLFLGFLAGLSGAVLRQFTSSSISLYFRPLAGIVAIIFAVLIFTYKDAPVCASRRPFHDRCGKGGAFLFGISVGMAPCAPLAVLLFDVAMLSKNPLDGLSYTLSFGAGSFVSGAIVISAAAGAMKLIPQRFFKSDMSIRVFKFACAAFLVLFGIRLILP